MVSIDGIWRELGEHDENLSRRFRMTKFRFISVFYENYIRDRHTLNLPFLHGSDSDRDFQRLAGARPANLKLKLS